MEDRQILNQGDNYMKSLLIAVLLIIIFPLSGGCAITNTYGPYYGKVIDGETKEPIEGAAILAVFYTQEYGPAGAITRYADAIETVTDKNGEFKLPAHRVSVFRPLQGWDKYPQFRIFKPTYGCYPMHKDVKPMFEPNGTLPADEHATIELPKIKTREERIDSTHCSPPTYIPYTKARNFIDLINRENKALGLEIEKYE
jgi:hypothetical protein